MERFSLGEDIRSLSEFRANAAVFLEQIHKTGKPLVLTQNGRGTAVVLDAAAYDRLMEKLELLEEIHLAETQMNEGLVEENEAARAAILAELKSLQ